MHKTIPEALDFAARLLPLIPDSKDVDKLIAPPFTSLMALSDALNGSGVLVASQDVFYEPKGAYTGEISVSMVKDAGASVCIVGHSERRQYFHETDDIVNRKVKATIAGGLGVVMCIGETLEERNAGKTFDVLKRQTSGGLAGITAGQMKDVVIAYEPVWAIGTGVNATPEQAQEAHAFIRSVVKELFPSGNVSGEVRILYGGSVKPDNVDTLMSCPDVDGALVGGASLEPESFARLINFKRGSK